MVDVARRSRRAIEVDVDQLGLHLRSTVIRRDRVQVEECLDPVTEHVDVLAADGVAHRVASGDADRDVVRRADHRPVGQEPRVEPTVVLVVAVAHPPVEALGREVERAALSRRTEDACARLHRVRGAVSVLGGPVERTSGAIDTPEPAAVVVIPHHIAQVVESVERVLAQPALVRVRRCQRRGGARLARLELEQAVRIGSGPPAPIERAAVPAPDRVDATGEPRVQHVSAEGDRELVGQVRPPSAAETERSRLLAHSRIVRRAVRPTLRAMRGGRVSRTGRGTTAPREPAHRPRGRGRRARPPGGSAGCPTRSIPIRSTPAITASRGPTSAPRRRSHTAPVAANGSSTIQYAHATTCQSAARLSIASDRACVTGS